MIFPRVQSCDFHSFGEYERRIEIDLDVEMETTFDIPIRFDYYSSFRTGESEIKKVSLASYLNDDRFNSDGRLCPEFPIPSNIANQIDISSNAMLENRIATCQLHAGRAGCIAPVHFDWDNRIVFHLCLSGSKRFMLIPPSAGWLMSPVVNTSALCLPRFSDCDRKRFLEMTGGVEHHLSKGEGVVFPSSAWHAVTYDSPSLAISVRIEKNKRYRPFGIFPRSWYLQRLVWLLQINDSSFRPDEFLASLFERFFAGYDTWYDRFKAVRELYCGELRSVGENEGVDRWIDDNFSAEIAMAGNELEFLYSLDNSGDPIDESTVDSAMNYIFEACTDFDIGLQRDAARYAVRTKQGLEPKRGLIEINQGDSI